LLTEDTGRGDAQSSGWTGSQQAESTQEGSVVDGVPQADIDLASLTLFSEFTSTELDAIAQEFEEEHAQVGERLLREGFVGGGFYVIVSGEADWLVGGHRVNRSATIFGRPPKPVTLRRGDWFGELSVLFDEPSISDVVALTPMQLLVIAGHELESFLYRYPKLMFQLLKGEARRLRDPERWK
jgi:CRP/FNR family cyclic AMP-dependent transcriptional regulator